ncbi:hypothetical protein MSC49_16930 [Methylosinus sp. C49]|uniref:heme-binding protein n=1 Tax=Methylosinus sp. C49 TaxID=2699395 RepID=UPI001367128D|nr:heme-binding protein [Methylosinus sp. C49]BBU61758.1 hypothetical protein MSC49_16930 [Methylosinus sp. C49]
MLKKLAQASAFALISASSASADAWLSRQNACSKLPSWQELHDKLQSVITQGGNSGLGFNMWATIVANDGTVCAVAFSGADYKGQWLASRVISAQKANTANGLSLAKGVTPASSAFGTRGLALATANLYSAVQPGGSLFGLQFSNPVDPDVAYLQQNGQPNDPGTFGKFNDPLVGRPIGGVNVFGGGLGLYDKGGVKVGGVGVSGDTSCTDHFVAWKLRSLLKLDRLGETSAGAGDGVAGVNADPKRPDNIVFDITAGVSASGWGHPKCDGGLVPTSLPPVRPLN